MPKSAKLYVIFVIALAGAIIASAAVLDRQMVDSARFWTYTVIACIASMLKVRLPRIQGTISLNFLILLIAIPDLSTLEVIAIGAAATLVQCFWRARTRPRLIQVAFNVSALAISSAAGWSAIHGLKQAGFSPVAFVFAAAVYFAVNTGLVSTVLSLITGRKVGEVWMQCHFWTFPYYLVGIAVAAVMVYSAREYGWESALLVLPLPYLAYLAYREYVQRSTARNDQASAAMAA